MACRCKCTAGFGEITHQDNTTECIDRNECVEFPTLRGRNAYSRNACQNLEGSFICSFETPNECTTDNAFNGCWQMEVDNVTITSCEVRTHVCMHALRSACLCSLPVFCVL